MSYRSKLKPKSAADAIEEEARKLKENEETALVLKQFIETFEEPANVNKTWVKGGVVTPGSSVQSLEGAGRVYQPYLKTLEKTAEKFKDRLSLEVEKSSNLGLKKDQAKKKSNLEAFSEELKQMQQEREMRQLKRKSVVDRVDDTTIKYGSDIESKASEEIRKSRFDSTSIPLVKASPLLSSYPYDLDSPYENENDRTSTNLFLGNLNPELTEQQLCELFGRFGPLASVKIMWPRSDEEKARGRNCGFVAFMNRTDGERALDKLRGEEICGYEMKLGWGKTVLIPPYPVYVPPALQELIKAPPFSGLPFNAQPREWLERQERGLPITDRIMYDMTSMTDDEITEILKTCVVKVVIPTDRSLMQLINRMVEFVVKEGVEFEAFIMNKEMRNPHFKFLFDFQSPEHIYYRWKLYSILHGESAKTWKTAEFQMYVDGPYWRPPPLNPYTAGMPEELIVDFDVSKLTLDNIRSMDQVTQNEHSRESVVAPVSGSTVSSNSSSTPCMDNPYNHNNPYKRLLSDGQRDRLMEMLTDLEPTKICIGETMVWCLEHADSAEEVVDVIVQQLDRSISDSIESSSSGLNRIVAHIFLVSDILHNSCAKVRNASYYRKFIENVLSQIMIAYNRYYLAITSKVKSEQLKHTVLTCFRAWGDWYVYPYDFLLKLQNQFLGIAEPTAVVPDEKTDSKVTSDDNMLDRKPLVDYDGDPLDLDGVPLESTNNLSAAKTNDSSHNNNIIDMFATSNSPTSTKNNDSAPLFVASKWETIDPAEEESEMVQSRWHLLEAQMDEHKSENEDPDGYPLSDNDGFDLNKIMMPESQNYRSMASLVSYEKGSSDDEVEEVKPMSAGARAGKKSKKKDKRRRAASSDEDGARKRSRRRTEEAADDVEEDTHQDEDRRRYRPEVVEVRSKVIRLEHRDDDRDSSRRSKQSPKDSRRSRDWTDKRGAGGYSDMKRKRSRSRSPSPAAKRSSHRRRSRDKRH